MARAMVFLPVLLLCVMTAALGRILGGRASLTTETEVIEQVAKRYLSEAGDGATRTDCAAHPASSSDLWLVVICGGYEYFVDVYGRLVHVNRPGGTS